MSRTQEWSRRALAAYQLLEGRWAAIALPVMLAIIFVFTRSIGSSVSILFFFVMTPLLFVRLLLEQLAGDAADPRDPGQPIGTTAKAFLVAIGFGSLATGILMLLDVNHVGAFGAFGIVSSFAMGPVMLAVGVRGRAFGALGRGLTRPAS